MKPGDLLLWILLVCMDVCVCVCVCVFVCVRESMCVSSCFCMHTFCVLFCVTLALFPIFTQIVSLYSSQHITDQGVVQLVQHNPGITHLNLIRLHRMTTEGVEAIAKFLGKNLVRKWMVFVLSMLQPWTVYCLCDLSSYTLLNFPFSHFLPSSSPSLSLSLSLSLSHYLSLALSLLLVFPTLLLLLSVSLFFLSFCDSYNLSPHS